MAEQEPGNVPDLDDVSFLVLKDGTKVYPFKYRWGDYTIWSWGPDEKAARKLAKARLGKNVFPFRRAR